MAGAAAILGYLTGKIYNYLDEDTVLDYCPFQKEMHQPMKAKELEVLYIYNNTYLKDLENKCKIAIYKQINKQSPNLSHMVKRCSLLVKYV